MDTDLEEYFKNITNKYTPEYFEELSKQNYIEDRNYPENFSNWYPHIVDFGKFKHAEIISNQILTREELKLFEVEPLTEEDIIKINESLKPTIDKMKPNRLYNIKNGCFSNKFDFDSSLATNFNLARQLYLINYQSSMYDTGGNTELVVREIIPNTMMSTHPTIYHGMPLREEVRVFYNMETKSIEYMVDYWDYDYCKEGMRNASDKIIFDWFHNKLPGRKESHEKEVENLKYSISSMIDTLKFDGELKGIWSIDFLYESSTNEIYLIDMARGFRSAYWNPDKIHKEE